MDENPVWRHEYKYVSPEYMLTALEARASHILQRDAHAGVQGGYSIRSVYFDDQYNTCYYENEDGTDPREKFRIRIYNGSSTRISLELKQKERGKCHKIAVPVPLAICETILSGNIPRVQSDMPYLLKKLVMQMQSRALKPVVIVAYERVPLIWHTGNVRVTFDRNIRSSADFHRFFSPDLACRPILAEQTNMIEVKFDALLPDFISELLQISRLRQTSFSKYYLCRRYNRAAEFL